MVGLQIYLRPKRCSWFLGAATVGLHLLFGGVVISFHGVLAIIAARWAWPLERRRAVFSLEQIHSPVTDPG